jgi:CRISPR-associated protein Csd1
LEALQGRIFALLPPERFPQILSLEDQGLFAVGYYHQREHFFTKRNSPPSPATETTMTTETKETNP